MSRPKRTEAEVQWRRERILAASAVVFQRVGFAASTMEEIAREAEYSPAALYNYFRSKEDIFLAALQQAADQMTRTLLEPLPEGTSFEQRLRWRLRRMTETALANLGILMALESPEASPSFRAQAAQIQLCLDRTHAPWTDLMAQGQREGCLRGDIGPEHLAHALMGMMRGTMKPAMSASPAPSLESLAALQDRLVDLFLNGAKCR
jgi:AcrR family transcriptional regulator